MSDHSPLWDGGPLFSAGCAYPISTDALVLADFVRIPARGSILDLGCGSGIIGVLLLHASPGIRADGIELLPEAADAARLNYAANGFDGRGRIITGDLREYRLPTGVSAYDALCANPPYHPAPAGALSPDAARCAARSDLSCPLPELCAAAARLCKNGGSFYTVTAAARLTDLFCALRAAKLEPKRLRLVCHTADSPPSLTLVESRLGGKPGLDIQPSLILKAPDGSDTPELRRIYHMPA